MHPSVYFRQLLLEFVVLFRMYGLGRVIKLLLQILGLFPELSH